MMLLKYTNIPLKYLTKTFFIFLQLSYIISSLHCHCRVIQHKISFMLHNPLDVFQSNLNTLNCGNFTQSMYGHVCHRTLVWFGYMQYFASISIYINYNLSNWLWSYNLPQNKPMITNSFTGSNSLNHRLTGCQRDS